MAPKKTGGAGAAGAGAASPGGDAPPASPFTPGMAPECLACPFGLVFFGLRNTRPEVMEHLMKAGFELFQAAKAFMDAYAERWEKAQKPQRIEIS